MEPQLFADDGLCHLSLPPIKAAGDGELGGKAPPPVRIVSRMARMD